ncbi:MAG TPA: hypothetical protein O0X39_01290 [Methanocorpusculum sp.]|nr:hypothetical protein [Methanocorpusculum sp.]
MAYCTTDDVRLLTNISTSDIDNTTLASLIEVAQRRCDARIKQAGLTAPVQTAEPTLQDAAAYFTAALILARKNTDLSRPNSHTVQDAAFTTNTAEDIAYHERIANTALKLYIEGQLAQQDIQAATLFYNVEGD